ncbi:MAG TPA: SDR family oxidoreductase, partial [Tepidiformaceae bacterium]|nr:SDR family oxidoreductase [Tepidiformaceae bacterium]
VMSRESVREAVSAAVVQSGNVTALFNNAGAGFPDTFPDPDDANFENDLSLNLTSVYRVSSEVWQGMVDAGGGAVVNMSSTAAVVAPSQSQRSAMPGLPSPGYAAGKAGVEGLTRYMASIGSPYNIRVNGIRPGQVVTPLTTRFTPGHHVFEGYFELTQLTPGPGTPEDVANLVVSCSAGTPASSTARSSTSMAAQQGRSNVANQRVRANHGRRTIDARVNKRARR